MFKLADNNCGECGKPVGLTDRQQIFFYPANKKTPHIDQPGAWKRVCGDCLMKLRPETR